MRISLLVSITLCFLTLNLFSQNLKMDSMRTQNLEGVVISATRYETPARLIPVPITVLKKLEISKTAPVRLTDVLGEQTGLQIITNHGKGIQMMGLDPSYTLILMDGLPMIGRAAGTLDLQRISTSNIERIEIIKGPASNIYGSDALAGVINIITEDPSQSNLRAGFRVASHNTYDAWSGIALNGEKHKFSLSANYFHTDGYDFAPQSLGEVVSPISSQTIQGKWSYFKSWKRKFTLTGRLFHEQQKDKFDLVPVNIPGKVLGITHNWDFSVNPTLEIKPNVHYTIQANLGTSVFKSNSRYDYASSGLPYSNDDFSQYVLRPEIQTIWRKNEQFSLSSGIGADIERVEAERYAKNSTFHSLFIYSQAYWKLFKKSTLMGGLRYDYHSEFSGSLSPKLSVSQEIGKKLTLKASAGKGYRAPDYRQLFLNFHNAIAGYDVFGSRTVFQGITDLQSTGSISQMLFPVDQLGDLTPEYSSSLQIGLDWIPTDKISFNTHLFYNDIKDMIGTIPVAKKTNGLFVYSYLNLHHVVTKGFDVELNYKPTSKLSFSAGYQYLEATDQDVISQLENSEIWARDLITMESYRVKLSQYGGLFNRSKHSGNFKIFYQWNERLNTNLRIIYRGKYGLTDLNGSQILDTEEEYVKGYFISNFAVNYSLGKYFTLKAGIEDILDYKDSEKIPNMPGRTFFFGIEFKKSITKSNT